MSLLIPPITAVCPRCYHTYGRELATALKGAATFTCPSCWFMWTKKLAQDFTPAFRKP
jgi:transposase-like protein